MILVLGGTSDALEIAGELYQVTKDVTISMATEYGFQVSQNRFPGDSFWKNGSRGIKKISSRAWGRSCG